MNPLGALLRHTLPVNGLLVRPASSRATKSCWACDLLIKQKQLSILKSCNKIATFRYLFNKISFHFDNHYKYQVALTSSWSSLLKRRGVKPSLWSPTPQILHFLDRRQRINLADHTVKHVSALVNLGDQAFAAPSIHRVDYRQ
jgi:hypothetical protein